MPAVTALVAKVLRAGFAKSVAIGGNFSGDTGVF
jgi:hypothetical protein